MKATFGNVNFTQLGLFIFVAPIVVFFDQLTKFLASSYKVVVCNAGFSFGITIGEDKASFISFITLSYLLYILLSGKEKKAKVPILLILAGGTSNLIDRVIFGCVRDFVRIWPFWNNIADLAITLGILLYLYKVVFKKNGS